MRLEGSTVLQVEELPGFTLEVCIKWTYDASVWDPEFPSNSNQHMLPYQGVQYTIVAACRKI